MLPSVLKDLSIEDFHFNIFIASEGLMEETKQAKKAQRAQRGRN